MDQRESIKNITAKTLIIGGTQDAGTTPAMAEAMANSIPEAKLVLLEAAHLSNVERSEEFNATLIEFLQGELAPPVTEGLREVLCGAQLLQQCRALLGADLITTEQIGQPQSVGHQP